MERNEAITLLTGGQDAVAEWNYRRAREVFHPPDLSSAELSGAMLATANLAYADLQGANLAGANLSRADLYRANLREARLAGANLSEARLLETALERADLRGVKFYRATLAHVDFRQANLERASFVEAWMIGGHFAETSLKGAIFGYTYLSSVLRDALQIEATEHLAKSRIALDTIQWFDVVPERFLRGCGVPEEEIAYFRSRVGTPIQFFSVFISYSHTDRHLAERLHAQLQRRGIRCWLDAHDLRPGRRILDAVDDAIRVHDRVVLCCSSASLESWWVKDEVRKAHERERLERKDIIIPVLFDRYLLNEWNDGLAGDLRSRRAADLTEWAQNENATTELELLIKALKTK